MKIAVIGYSGAGKSTLASRLGQLWGLPVLHLDTVQFLPGWEERPRDEACALVADFMAREGGWVIDGNYADFLQAERLLQADRIIFLNFARLPCLIRVFRRYWRFRGSVRSSMAEGCCEKLDIDFVLWVLYKGRTRNARVRFRAIIDAYPHKVVEIRNQRQLDAFVRTEASAARRF